MFNKSWDLRVKAAWEDWSVNFNYLKQLPNYHSFVMMLGAATSINHLDALHEMLPENCRLLRDDWIKFKSFWKRTFTGERAEQLRSQLIQWLLFEQSIDWNKEIKNNPANTGVGLVARAMKATSNITDYYILRIEECATKTPPGHFGDSGASKKLSSLRVLSCSQRSGHGYEHFQMRLFGETVDVAIKLNENKKHMLFRFIFSSRQLTEDLTHKIISQLPAYYIYRYGVTTATIGIGEPVCYLNIAFELETGDLIKWLKTAEHNDLIAMPEFAPAATKAVLKFGLPLEGELVPITTSVHERKKG